jgi:hypothetical protein
MSDDIMIGAMTLIGIAVIGSMTLFTAVNSGDVSIFNLLLLWFVSTELIYFQSLAMMDEKEIADLKKSGDYSIETVMRKAFSSIFAMLLILCVAALFSCAGFVINELKWNLDDVILLTSGLLATIIFLVTFYLINRQLLINKVKKS